MAALAYSPLGVLVCGVEPDPAGARVYIGARYRGRYFIARGEDADKALRVWRGSIGHVVMDRRQVGYLLTEYRSSRRADAFREDRR